MDNFQHVDIGGQEGMKLICGIIAVEGKVNLGKDDKVFNIDFFFLRVDNECL